jgi:hypothetical protein
VLVGSLSLTALAFAFPAPVKAIMVVTWQETGADVVFSYSGSINLTGLETPGSETFGGSSIKPDNSAMYFSTIAVDRYNTSITGPSSFATGATNFFPPSSSSGAPFAFVGSNNLGDPLVAFAPGYTGENISGTMTFANTTLSALSIDTSQSYTWTLDDNGDTITLQAAAPVPLETDALPVVASAAFMAGGLWWKRRRAKAKVADFVAQK